MISRSRRSIHVPSGIEASSESTATPSAWTRVARVIFRRLHPSHRRGDRKIGVLATQKWTQRPKPGRHRRGRDPFPPATRNASIVPVCSQFDLLTPARSRKRTKASKLARYHSIVCGLALCVLVAQKQIDHIYQHNVTPGWMERQTRLSCRDGGTATLTRPKPRPHPTITQTDLTGKGTHEFLAFVAAHQLNS